MNRTAETLTYSLTIGVHLRASPHLRHLLATQWSRFSVRTNMRPPLMAGVA